ncbi:MAG TPA: glycoside hydrolase family 2 protein [Candidatus Marinimicrobia bacterium]|nr:glycoside hydrolase family 2 protein [Candidatus Neomarinimicrobiota bacterium]
MNKLFLIQIILLGILPFFSCVNIESRAPLISFENWEFRQAGTKTWYPAEVPGHVHTDLMKNGLIPDPFIGTNELEVQWVENEDWEYLSHFQINQSQLHHDRIDLTFEGLDTYADIVLNDSLILKTDNMYIPWSVDVKKYLRMGENVLQVYFHSPVLWGQKKLNIHPHLIPASNEAKPVGQQTSVFTRKAQYHYGWDWGPRLVTSGIWRPVTLEVWNGAKINDIYYHLDSLSKYSADYSIELYLKSVNEIDAELTIRIADKISSHRTYLKQGENKLIIPQSIKNPILWWPNGYGEQMMYDIEIIITQSNQILDRKNEKIGVRKVEVIQNPDSPMSSFYIQINNTPIFMKGANYIPGDFFNTRASNRYQEVIQNAREANMNMLRIWGGAIYENDEFYNLCDKNGILIWQDFMFACCMVPSGKNYIHNIKQEAESNVKRLRNHPSLALWCGNNESLTGWREWNWQDTYSLHGQDSAAVWETYDHIFHTLLPHVVDSLDPGKFYWSSSPSSGSGILQNSTSGDQHEWGVWFGQMAFKRYKENAGRFISEYGLQSIPEMNTIQKFDSTITKWTLETKALNFRQRSKMPWISKNYTGFDMMEYYISKYFSSPENLEEFIYLSQLTQALGLTNAIHAHRRNRPYTMGSLYWQIDDVWPTVSWSSVDYFGNWKAAHYGVKKAFAPVLISPDVKDSILTITVVNDKLKGISGTLFLNLFTLDGLRVFSIDSLVNIKANSALSVYTESTGELLCGQNKNNVYLSTYLETGDSTLTENIFYFSDPKYLRLKPPKFSTSIKQNQNNWIVSLTASALAKDVYLSFDTVMGKWSDNYFDLQPGAEKTVIFTPEIDLKTLNPKLNIVSLADIIE